METKSFGLVLIFKLKILTRKIEYYYVKYFEITSCTKGWKPNSLKFRNSFNYSLRYNVCSYVGKQVR